MKPRIKLLVPPSPAELREVRRKWEQQCHAAIDAAGAASGSAVLAHERAVEQDLIELDAGTGRLRLLPGMSVGQLRALASVLNVRGSAPPAWAIKREVVIPPPPDDFVDREVRKMRRDRAQARPPAPSTPPKRNRPKIKNRP